MECCFCKEYSNRFDNQYYNGLGREIDVSSRILFETNNWYVVPALGCLTVGYVLLICKLHYQSLANLSVELYQELLVLKCLVENTIFCQTGLKCLVFEHGSTNPCCVGANSVDHVHLHIVPVAKTIWTDMVKKYGLTGFVAMTTYESLFSLWKSSLPQTYLLFQDIDEKIHYNPDATGFPSQFFRRYLASYFGIKQWDWKKEFHQMNFVKTLELFSNRMPSSRLNDDKILSLKHSALAKRTIQGQT